jgi:hypothetical protein
MEGPLKLISLYEYTNDRKASDVPEFVEQLLVNDHWTDNRSNFDYCMYWFYQTGKLKSARKLLEFYPYRFDQDLFDNMCTDGCVEGMVHMIDMGMQLDWVTTEDIPETALTFHFARNRARKRAIILLGVPARVAGGDKSGKDIWRIIARVIWAMRRFN